jgi:hypothetical protein
MITGAVTVVALVFFLFFAIYKKDMLIKMFSLNAAVPANQFQQQLEETANLVIQRLEDQISHLEYLLQEADEKIAVLDERLQHTEVIIKQLNNDDSFATIHTEEMIVDSAETEVGLVENRQGDFVDKSQEKEIVNNDKHRLILAMADQGYNVTEIAKATSVGKGEVMLLLQLNKK